MLRCFVFHLFLVLSVLVTQPAPAQVVAGGGNDSSDAVELPEVLTPEVIDGLMARMTDAQIREILRDELVRRSDETAAADDAGLAMTIEQVGIRLEQMVASIDRRVTRWLKALGNLQNRAPKVAERMSMAEGGPIGMVFGAALVLTGGVLSASLVLWLTRNWRAWLQNPRRENYWDKIIRTLALGIVEVAPIIAFVLASRLLVPAVSGLLGPLADFQWIYTTGVSYSWAFIVFTRRAFAPDAPAIRIAPLDDDLATTLHRLMRRAVRVGAAGWLVGGVFFHLGYGFPPAMVLRAFAGTVVAGILLLGLWRNAPSIRRATSLVFDERTVNSTLARIAVAGAPWGLATYIAGAWIYWLAHWLERGVDRLGGPAGTLVVYLALPIFDRMGRELIGSMIGEGSDLALRMRRVFWGAWRLMLGLIAFLLIAWLWGLNLLALAKGANAPIWASTTFDIAITLFLGYLMWRLVRAALHTEQRVSSASEDADPSEVPQASRLNTLTPLFRNFLLAFLMIIVTMITLSAVGVDIGPLIASAGIVGIAIGFGAQSLVRDIFSGIFFLVDDAFRVGEYIELDTEMRGEVESISIRSLQLRHHRGPVITIPFGELKQITNHNRDWVIYKMPFRMEPDTDPQKFKKLVKEIGKEFLTHPEHGPKFIEPLKSQGVYYVDDDSALVMRVKFKCKPRAQFVLRREIYHRLRAEFAQAGMNLARRKVEVVGPDGKTVDDRTTAGLPDEVLQTTPGAAPAG